MSIAAYDLAGEGPQTLFGHAAGFHATALAPLARRLSPHLHALALDLHGHGRSTWSDARGGDWLALGDDVLAVLDATTSAGPLGVGHSLGATALLLAEASHPGTFRALFCYEPIAFTASERAAFGRSHPLSSVARRRRARFSSREEARARFRDRPPFDRFDGEVFEAYLADGLADTDGGVELRCTPEHEAAIYDAALTTDVLERLATVGCPVVVAHGAVSGQSEIRSSNNVVEALEDARAVGVEGLGHFGPLESPVAVAATILDALAPYLG